MKNKIADTNQSWINVNDYLPKKVGQYLVVVDDRNEPLDDRIWNAVVVVIADYHPHKSWCHHRAGREYKLTDIVTHWKPMAEPPIQK